MIKSPIVKNILSAVAVAVFGFLLLNLTFLFDFLFQNLVDAIVSLFVKLNVDMAWNWYPRLKHILFVGLIGLISFFIFKSRLGVLYKSIFLSVPLAVVFVSLGMFLYHWPIAVYSLGTLFALSFLYYFYRTKQPWLYSYTVILVGVSLAIFTLLGGEI